MCWYTESKSQSRRWLHPATAKLLECLKNKNNKHFHKQFQKQIINPPLWFLVPLQHREHGFGGDPTKKFEQVHAYLGTTEPPRGPLDAWQALSTEPRFSATNVLQASPATAEAISAFDPGHLKRRTQVFNAVHARKITSSIAKCTASLGRRMGQSPDAWVCRLAIESGVLWCECLQNARQHPIPRKPFCVVGHPDAGFVMVQRGENVFEWQPNLSQETRTGNRVRRRFREGSQHKIHVFPQRNRIKFFSDRPLCSFAGTEYSHEDIGSQPQRFEPNGYQTFIFRTGKLVEPRKTALVKQSFRDDRCQICDEGAESESATTICFGLGLVWNEQSRLYDFCRLLFAVGQVDGFEHFRKWHFSRGIVQAGWTRK